MDFEVDIVYTWVNGDDPEHIKARSLYTEDMANSHKTSSVTSRWASTDEIVESYNSIVKFLPWVRNIYVVVGLRQEIPKELKGKVQVVYHDQIIPSEYLPTFNSQVIELYLYKIEGLSEHFIYFNDDCFVGKPMDKLDFYDQLGRPRVFCGNSFSISNKVNHDIGYNIFDLTPHFMNIMNYLIIPQSNSNGLPLWLTSVVPFLGNDSYTNRPGWYCSRTNNGLVLDYLYGNKLRKDLTHQAKALSKSVMNGIWNNETIRPMLLKTSKSRFRRNSDIEPVGLSLWVGLEENLCVLSETPTTYMVNIKDNTSISKIRKRLESDDIALYCLNDDRETYSEEQVSEYRELLNHHLPHQR